MIGFIAPYAFITRDYRQYSAMADFHTLQFTVTHALEFSVFYSRILGTDLSQHHCHFKSHVKSSLHSLIPFLPFLLHHLLLTSPELDSIPLLAAWYPRYIATRRIHRKHSLHHLFYCSVTSPRTRTLRALRSSGCTIRVSWHLFIVACGHSLPRGSVYRVVA
jgi:hypothetical protein